MRDTEWVIHRAINQACNEGVKGPVHIDLPKDISNQIVPITNNDRLLNVSDDLGFESVFEIPKIPKIDPIHKLKIPFVTQLCQTALRPIVLLGAGAIEASDEAKRLAETLDCPVISTLHGRGIIPTQNQGYLGVLGNAGDAAAMAAAKQADLVISIGYAYNNRDFHHNLFRNARNAALCASPRGGVISIESSSTSSDSFSDVPTEILRGDISSFVNLLTHQLERSRGDVLQEVNESRDQWIKKCIKSKEKNESNKGRSLNNETKLVSTDILRSINEWVLKNNKINKTIYCTGHGAHQIMAARCLDINNPRQFLTSSSSRGVGILFAQGAKLAHPEKNVIVIEGDTSFNTRFNDLCSISREQMPLKIFIMNNDDQDSSEYRSRLTAAEPVIDSFNPKYEILAKAFSIDYFLIAKKEDLKKIPELLAEDNRPIVIECKISDWY